MAGRGMKGGGGVEALLGAGGGGRVMIVMGMTTITKGEGEEGGGMMGIEGAKESEGGEEGVGSERVEMRDMIR